MKIEQQTPVSIYAKIKNEELTGPMLRIMEVTDRATLNKILFSFSSTTIYFSARYWKKDVLASQMIQLENVIGRDKAKILAEEFSNQNIHIPRITKFKNFIKRYLEENKEHTSAILALKLGVSEFFLFQNK